MHSQFTPIHLSERRDAEGSTIKLLHFPFNLGNEEHAWENNFVLFHRPQPFATPRRKDVSWREERCTLQWLETFAMTLQRTWIWVAWAEFWSPGTRFALSGKGEFTGLIGELLFERDLQKTSLSSYMNLGNLKNMNMKIEWWKKHIPRSRFLHEGSPEGKTGFFFMSFNALSTFKRVFILKAFFFIHFFDTIALVLRGREPF